MWNLCSCSSSLFDFVSSLTAFLGLIGQSRRMNLQFYDTQNTQFVSHTVLPGSKTPCDTFALRFALKPNGSRVSNPTIPSRTVFSRLENTVLHTIFPSSLPN